MIGLVKEFFRKDIFKNVLTLSGSQIVGYVFPIITLPYLARVLGPSEFGAVAFAQSFALCICLPIEYGFLITGARIISQHREDRETIANTLTGAICVKILLAGAISSGAYLIHDFFPLFQNNKYLFWASIFFGISFYSSMLWYYEGLEKMRVVAAFELMTKGLGAACIFIFIHSPIDAWKVLIFQGMGFLIVTASILASAWKNGLLRMPNFGIVRDAVKNGWPMFVFRSSESLYQMGAAFILGIFAPPAIVGYYSGAERMAKIFIGLLLPINKALFPRMSILVQNSMGKATRLLRYSLIISGCIGLAIFLIVNLVAPILTELILGEQFGEAVTIFRILAILPFLIALKQALGFQWMLAMGMERPFNAIIIACGVANLVIVLSIVPWFYHYGMAVAVVATELLIPVIIYFYLEKKGFNPFSEVLSS